MTALMTRSETITETLGARLMKALVDISKAKDVETVWDTVTETLALVGFDRVIYGSTHYRTERSYGDPQDMLILSAHDPDYVETFLEEAMYFHAPMVKWAQENNGACSWSWIADNLDHLTPAERRVIDFNRSMGVVAGYTISFPHRSHRSRAAIALTARRGMSQTSVDAIWSQAGTQLELLCNVAHLKIMSLPHAGRRRPLTARQREVLEWVGDGKTTQDIATIMGLTAATIEKHLRLARETLDVDTTAQAVMKATMQNQIFLIEG